MESKFYIGQRVVAVENHINGDFEKNDVFTVLEIKKLCCGYVIKINNKINYIEVAECFCGSILNTGTSFYYAEKRFAPIQEQKISNFTFEEAIELVTVKQL